MPHNDLRLLRIGDVAEILNVAVITIAKWVRSGHFPEPLRIGRKSARWRRAQIEAYLDAAAARRGSGRRLHP